LNSQTKLPGKKRKIDPKVQKLAQRDLELAMKQRERLAHQRKTEKEWSRDRFARPRTAVKKSKNPYKDVQSKIKTSVVQDRSRYALFYQFLDFSARGKSAGKVIKKVTRTTSKSHAQRKGTFYSQFPA
jgi:hypothetical protein